MNPKEYLKEGEIAVIMIVDGNPVTMKGQMTRVTYNSQFGDYRKETVDVEVRFDAYHDDIRDFRQATRPQGQNMPDVGQKHLPPKSHKPLNP